MGVVRGSNKLLLLLQLFFDGKQLLFLVTIARRLWYNVSQIIFYMQIVIFNFSSVSIYFLHFALNKSLTLCFNNIHHALLLILYILLITCCCAVKPTSCILLWYVPTYYLHRFKNICMSSTLVGQYIAIVFARKNWQNQ